MKHFAQLPSGRYLGEIQTRIMRASRRRPVGYDYLLTATPGTSRASLHVQVHRLVNEGLLNVVSPGTRDAKFQATVMPRLLARGAGA